jgi:hypothetical protein
MEIHNARINLLATAVNNLAAAFGVAGFVGRDGADNAPNSILAASPGGNGDIMALFARNPATRRQWPSRSLSRACPAGQISANTGRLLLDADQECLPDHLCLASGTDIFALPP